jgi:hypothetical protein
MPIKTVNRDTEAAMATILPCFLSRFVEESSKTICMQFQLLLFGALMKGQ